MLSIILSRMMDYFMPKILRITPMQRDWCDKILEGKSQTQAAVEAYGLQNDRREAATKGYKLRKNKNCRAYIDHHMEHASAVPEALQAIIDMLKANKHTREKGKTVSVGPDWNARLRAAETIFKIARIYDQNGNTDSETHSRVEINIPPPKELDIFTLHYIAKYNEYPASSADLEKFKETLDVKAIETRTSIVKSGEDIEYLPTVTPKFVSLKPVNFAEESISRLSPVDGSVQDQKPGNDVADDQRTESANLGEVERKSYPPSLEEIAEAGKSDLPTLEEAATMHKRDDFYR